MLLVAIRRQTFPLVVNRNGPATFAKNDGGPVLLDSFLSNKYGEVAEVFPEVFDGTLLAEVGHVDSP